MEENDEAIQTAIKALATKASGREREREKADDAMKFSQAALNLAHVIATLESARRSRIGG